MFDCLATIGALCIVHTAPVPSVAESLRCFEREPQALVRFVCTIDRGAAGRPAIIRSYFGKCMSESAQA